MCTLVTIHCLSDASIYSESFSLLLYRRCPTRRFRITLLSTPHTVNYGSRIAEITFALQLTCSATISDFRTCSCVFVHVTVFTNCIVVALPTPLLLSVGHMAKIFTLQYCFRSRFGSNLSCVQ